MNLIVNTNEVASIVEDLRKNKKTIVFTNGCFDILHRGHVEYLEKAKKHGHILVVGLNSDSSVKKLKGQNRPFVVQDDRAYILSRLEAVDIVCFFDQDTPEKLIRVVKPDVLIKGGDYSPKNIVGKDFVESYSGKVLTIPLVQGRSTTNLVDKIKYAK